MMDQIDLTEVEDTDRMIFLEGWSTSFRCDNPMSRGKCGGNVFRQLKGQPKRFKCNSCGATFTGE